MCSNYLFPNKRNLTLLGVDTSQFDLELKDHVFPSYHAPIILNGSDHLELDIAKFGLLPSWAKELKFSSHTYNARTESVADKPSFRHAMNSSHFHAMSKNKTSYSDASLFIHNFLKLNFKRC